jgi:hypothetical protein
LTDIPSLFNLYTTILKETDLKFITKLNPSVWKQFNYLNKKVIMLTVCNKS